MSPARPTEWNSTTILTASTNHIPYTTGPGPTGAINRIMREITTLQTSLPVEYGAGIWIRVDEDKPHVMKVLISGPMDTPYAQGLFEFDILLPANYPNSPPQVRRDGTAPLGMDVFAWLVGSDA